MPTQAQLLRGLDTVGLSRTGQVYWNLVPPALFEAAIRRDEGHFAAEGPFVGVTAPHTGRSPNDKFVVREPSSDEHIDWGNTNRPLDPVAFDVLHREMAAYLEDKALYVLDAWAGADPAYRIPIRVVNEFAWHNAFARNMFLPENDPAKRAEHAPQFTVIDAPGFTADPARHGVRSETFIVLNFAKQLVLIGGTRYAGEIKKSVFTLLNYLLPLQGVLPMHCSANVGEKGDSALFFGLSGTGKTTLSSDPQRQLIGDDEHGWSDQGVFNFEGGCYAKVIKLSSEAEPQIYAATRRFGAILENVVTDPETRALDFDDESLTENTRGSYPLEFIDNAILSGQAGHPTNIVMLTADAYGVLPPISRLNPDAAMYHFLSGYTAKVAGTEQGVTEPKAVFSTCFGAPFLPMRPHVYAELLGQKIAKHNANVWLVNTGWTGGPYGVGKRMGIAHTRAMIAAALDGQLSGLTFRKDAIFNVDVPTSCPGVPDGVLDPRSTWSNPQAYDEQARKLAGMFVENFKAFETGVAPSVKDAGPKV
jgi:phosphoenolpyruvate carboxykinase (ATP)